MTEKIPQHQEYGYSPGHDPHSSELRYEAPVRELVSLSGVPDELRRELDGERRDNAYAGARQAVEALEFREKIEASKIDVLTGLHNSRAFSEDYEGIFNRKKPGEMTVLFIDARNLKAVNNGINHAAGDRYLRAVANSLSETLRPGDRIYRKGGDEFVVLADKSAEGSLDGFVERVDMVANKTIAARVAADDELAAVGYLGVHVGGAVKEPADTPESMLMRADEACVQAKSVFHVRQELEQQ